MACRHHHFSLAAHHASLRAVFAVLLSVLFLRPTTVLAAGVVGTGAPESCTEAELDDALAGGGLVTFNCGTEPVTITLSAEKVITAETAKTTVDGGQLVTLSGGGAVRVFNVNEGAMLEVQYLTVANGNDLTASNGGGIYNEGVLTVTNSTLRDNGGGGIYNKGSLDVTNSTLSGNSGRGAGGIRNEGAANISNSTLTANRNSGTFGGGILNQGTAQVINSTIAGNAIGSVWNFGTLTITNTIIKDKLLACLGNPVNGADNLIEDAANLCGFVNGVNGNIVGVDPLLDPAGLQDNGGPTQTIALLPDSLAINAGDPDVCADPPVNNVDQRGVVRPSIGHTQCSIGAYEADATAPGATATPTPTATPTQTPRIVACIGDCSDNGQVTVDELVTLVSIALGNARSSACPYGIPSGAAVDVALLIQTVNSALTGCGG